MTLFIDNGCRTKTNCESYLHMLFFFVADLLHFTSRSSSELPHPIPYLTSTCSY